MNKLTLWCRLYAFGHVLRPASVYDLTLINNRFSSSDVNKRKPFEENDPSVTSLDDSPERVVKVAVIGVPNAGKSTLINSLIDRRICATSSKVHTTRAVSRGICTEGNTQIVFLDTPGLVSKQEKKRYQLEESFVNQFKTCMQQADAVCVVHDASNNWTRDKLNIKVRKLLEKFPGVPSVLVLNKIDLLKSKRVLLDLTQTLTEGRLSNRHHKVKPEEDFTLDIGDEDNNNDQSFSDPKKSKHKIGWPNFTNVFMVSSIEQTGMEELKEYLVSLSQPSPWSYSPVQHSDLSDEQIIVQAVRAKLLDFMPQEIPYRLKTEMEYYDESENGGAIVASLLVTCPSPRIQRLLEGESGGKLRQITTHVIKDLQEALYPRRVSVVITVTSPPTTQ